MSKLCNKSIWLINSPSLVIDLQTFEEGSNATLTCGNSNLSSATILSWSKDERLLVNITSNNSTLVLSNLTANGSGLYVCSANSSIILRRVRLAITTRGEDSRDVPFFFCGKWGWKD